MNTYLSLQKHSTTSRMSSKGKGYANSLSLHSFSNFLKYLIILLNLFAEIITISSSESSEASAEWTASWASYFPKSYVGSSITKEAARKHKFDAKEPCANEPCAKEPSAKDPFKERKKVLGLPSAQFCEDHGIIWKYPKIPNECSKGKGKKQMG